MGEDIKVGWERHLAATIEDRSLSHKSSGTNAAPYSIA